MNLADRYDRLAMQVRCGDAKMRDMQTELVAPIKDSAATRSAAFDQFWISLSCSARLLRSTSAAGAMAEARSRAAQADIALSSYQSPTDRVRLEVMFWVYWSVVRDLQHRMEVAN